MANESPPFARGRPLESRATSSSRTRATPATRDTESGGGTVVLAAEVVRPPFGMLHSVRDRHASKSEAAAPPGAVAAAKTIKTIKSILPLGFTVTIRDL